MEVRSRAEGSPVSAASASACRCGDRAAPRVRSLLSMLIPLLAAVVSSRPVSRSSAAQSYPLDQLHHPEHRRAHRYRVAVDYALFVVTRHRNAAAGLSPSARHCPRDQRTCRGVRGSTVVVAMLGLLTLGVSFLSGVGIAAAITVAVAVGAATTLLPAVFRLMACAYSAPYRRSCRGFADAHDSRSGMARWPRSCSAVRCGSAQEH